MFGSIVSFLEEFFEVMGVSLTSRQVGFHLGCPWSMGIGHLAVSLAQPRPALSLPCLTRKVVQGGSARECLCGTAPSPGAPFSPAPTSLQGPPGALRLIQVDGSCAPRDNKPAPSPPETPPFPSKHHSCSP